MGEEVATAPDAGMSVEGTARRHLLNVPMSGYHPRGIAEHGSQICRFYGLEIKDLPSLPHPRLQGNHMERWGGKIPDKIRLNN